jgi:predicted transposase YdaD
MMAVTLQHKRAVGTSPGYAESGSHEFTIVAKKVADIGGKRLVSLSPDAWVQWVTQQPDVIAQEIMGADFQWVSRENDVLIKCLSPNDGEFLTLTELQLRYPAKMPLRVRAYSALAEEKYELPVYPVLINILPPARNVIIPDRYERNFMGLQARQDYRVINLWEVEAEMVFDQNLVSLMPFVPILQGGDEEAVVQRAVRVLQRDEQLSELESLLAFFASFVLETEVVAQIMRWDMAVLRESPWYQEILQQGLREGEQQGEQRGILLGEERGRQQGECALVLRQLTRRLRLDSLPASLRAQVEQLSLPQLETLGEALLDFQSVADLEAWLQNA